MRFYDNFNYRGIAYGKDFAEIENNVLRVLEGRRYIQKTS